MVNDLERYLLLKLAIGRSARNTAPIPPRPISRQNTVGANRSCRRICARLFAAGSRRSTAMLFEQILRLLMTASNDSTSPRNALVSATRLREKGRTLMTALECCGEDVLNSFPFVLLALVLE